jgi:hypothetical protein
MTVEQARNKARSGALRSVEDAELELELFARDGIATE